MLKETIDIPKYIPIFLSLLKGNNPEPFEIKWVRKDGEIRSGILYVSALKKDSKVTGIQAIIADVTEEKKYNLNYTVGRLSVI